ncbi:MAG: hypothetical protein BGN86_09125 [Caulobacterales bacterium 68-7]|nr:DUF4180 domain-containing protein [Caulobacterales bacterium]OJU13703.1 MAG: hypothetical protein BGN86_09125 [Caulobacterales bacterium 68-7]
MADLLVLPAEGPLLGDERSASDVTGDAISAGAAWVAIPVARLAPGFLQLSTRLAGLFLQKLVNYRIGVAIVGDVSAETEASDALNAFVIESNRGSTVWFVKDIDELHARLSRAGERA